MGLALGACLLFTSCEDTSGIAPNNLKGMTMNISGYKITFSSNTEARIQPFDDDRNEYPCASIEYKKTGPASGTLKIDHIEVKGYDYEYSRENYDLGWESYNFSLIFSSPNEGIYSGTWVRGENSWTSDYNAQKGSFSSDDVHRFTIF